jgi:hypothetical protein
MYTLKIQIVKVENTSKNKNMKNDTSKYAKILEEFPRQFEQKL